MKSIIINDFIHRWNSWWMGSLNIPTVHQIIFKIPVRFLKLQRGYVYNIPRPRISVISTIHYNDVIMSKKTSKLRVTGLCEGNSPVTVEIPHKGPVTREKFPFEDVMIFMLRLLLINSDVIMLQVWKGHHLWRVNSENLQFVAGIMKMEKLSSGHGLKVVNCWITIRFFWDLRAYSRRHYPKPLMPKETSKKTVCFLFVLYQRM